MSLAPVGTKQDWVKQI